MHRPLLFPGLVCLILCSGCLGLVSDEEIETNLIVTFDQDRLTIETVYEQRELISSSTATFVVDFSQTTSDVSIETFGITTDDGRSITIDASKEKSISLDFEHHGAYSTSVTSSTPKV